MIKRIMYLSEFCEFQTFADKNNIGYVFNMDFSVPAWRARFEVSIFVAQLLEKLENTEFSYLLEN